MKSLFLVLSLALAMPAVSGQWEIASSMPSPRQEIYADVAGGRVYVPGGVGADGLSTSSAFEAYDAVNDRWLTLAPLPEPRHHVTPAVIGNRVFAIGGFTGPFPDWEIKADSFVYDINSNSWKRGTPMPEPQAEHVSAVVNGKIHIIGGRIHGNSGKHHFDAFSDTGRHRVYDPGSDQWSLAAPAPTARNSAAAAVVSGRIYVVGGRHNVVQEDGTQLQQNLGTLEVYDPQSDSWETRAPMPEGLGGNAAAALNGKLYVFGGEQWAPTQKVFTSAWVYDPGSDSWSGEADMPTGRHGLAAATAAGKLVVIGGGNKVGGGGAGGFTEILLPDVEIGPMIERELD